MTPEAGVNTPETPKKTGNRGAQPGNTNAAKHGRRAQRTSLCITRMAKHHDSFEGNLHTMRKRLEAQVRESQGITSPETPLSSTHDTLIGTAIDAERVRRMAQRLARTAMEEGRARDALELERTALSASQRRTDAINSLGLDTQDTNPWTFPTVPVYAPPCDADPEDESEHLIEGTPPETPT